VIHKKADEITYKKTIYSILNVICYWYPLKYTQSIFTQIYTIDIHSNIHNRYSLKYTQSIFLQIYTIDIHSNIHNCYSLKYTQLIFTQIYTIDIHSNIHNRYSLKYTQSIFTQIYTIDIHPNIHNRYSPKYTQLSIHVLLCIAYDHKNRQEKLLEVLELVSLRTLYSEDQYYGFRIIFPFIPNTYL